MVDRPFRLLLIRHGVTAWNREQRLQGHSDVQLNTDGHIQAARMASRLAQAETPLKAIYSSDLQRARSTAEAIAAPLGLSVRPTTLLRETMLGDWEGLTAEDIVARGDEAHWLRYRTDAYLHRPPRSESMEQVWERMSRAYADIREEFAEGDVAVVGHGGSLRVLLCEALNAPITSMKHLYLSNAGLSIIEEAGPLERRVRRVVLMNDTSHLDRGEENRI